MSITRKIAVLLGAAAVLILSGGPVPALDDTLPRNIRIDVEFKEFGEASRGIGAAKWRSEKSNSYTKQFIVVSDGLSAGIFVGQEVPYITYYRQFLWDHEYLETGIEIREVGTKLRVEPHIIGNIIEITLTPEVSYISDRGRGTIDIKTLSTTVMAADGQSIPIGGLQKDAEFDKYFFSRSSGSNLEIILTPHIQ